MPSLLMLMLMNLGNFPLQEQNVFFSTIEQYFLVQEKEGELFRRFEEKEVVKVVEESSQQWFDHHFSFYFDGDDSFLRQFLFLFESFSKS